MAAQRRLGDYIITTISDQRTQARSWFFVGFTLAISAIYLFTR